MTTTGVMERGAPGGRAAGWWWWQRRRSALLDGLLAAVSALECAVEGASFAGRGGLPAGAGAVFGLAVGATLLLRRRWPIAVVLIALAVAPAQMGAVLEAVGLYTLAASDVPRRVTGAVVAMTVAGTLVVSFVTVHQSMAHGGYGGPAWLVLLVSVLTALGLTAPPVLLGLYTGARRRLVESLRERADGLERELSLLAEKAEERAERARMEERTRIAREMHDVVAHRVSLMVVHASALASVVHADPERAAGSARLLGDMGRQALNELRQMLGVLRAAPATDAAAGGAGAVRVAQGAAAGLVGQAVVQPGGAAVDAAVDAGRAAGNGDGPRLAQLGVLVEQSRAAGMAVSLSEEGDRRPLAAPVERAAYRVVQEALTNVHKHAAGAQTVVRVAYRSDEIAVLVENGPAAGQPSAGLPSGGNGLLGMKERVTGLGGGFVAGATLAGGFRVSAVIPARAA